MDNKVVIHPAGVLMIILGCGLTFYLHGVAFEKANREFMEAKAKAEAEQAAKAEATENTESVDVKNTAPANDDNLEPVEENPEDTNLLEADD